MDIVQKMESILVNELSQTISKQIVAKIFEMGSLNRTSAPLATGKTSVSATASTIPTSQVARVSIGSIAGVMGDSPEKLMKTAKVAALKLQGILRGSDKKKSH